MIPIKEPSHKRVFSLIRAQRKASGAMLAKQTMMQPSSLVYILNSLKDKGLICVSGHGDSTARGGKRPVLWEVNSNYGNILGLEVMRHGIRAVLVNLAGEIILKAEKDFTPDKPEKIVARIVQIIDEMIGESGISRNKLLYISLAVPGIVDPYSQKIVYSYGLKLENFDLKTRITDAFDIPAGVINDANAGVIGDQWFTSGSLANSNSLYIAYNPLAGGIGLGIIINKKLYTGSNGLAGEFSLRITALKDIIEEKLKTADPARTSIPNPDKPGSIQLSDLYTYANNQCELSKTVLTQVCQLLAKEISKLIGLFDPDKISIGGDLSICEQMCCSEIHKHLKTILQNDYPFEMTMPKIDYVRSKVFAVAIGATALYLTNLSN